MHLVFLGAQEHLKAGFGRRHHAGRNLDTLRGKFVGLAFQPLCPSLHFVAKKGDDLCLAARSLLLGHDAPYKLRKVESLKCGAPLYALSVERRRQVSHGAQFPLPLADGTKLLRNRTWRPSRHWIAFHDGSTFSL